MLSRDDILRMAREAQWLGNIEGWTFNSYDELERFFRLAYEAGAAAEREACAQECDKIERRKWKIVMNGGAMQGIGARDCAAAIRARGQQRPEPKVTHLNEWARNKLARHGIQLPDEDEEYGNPSF
jgi:hypothetical protein